MMATADWLVAGLGLDFYDKGTYESKERKRILVDLIPMSTTLSFLALSPFTLQLFLLQSLHQSSADKIGYLRTYWLLRLVSYLCSTCQCSSAL